MSYYYLPYAGIKEGNFGQDYLITQDGEILVTQDNEILVTEEGN